MTISPSRPPSTIRIRRSDGVETDVSRLAYIDAKWKQMRDMGYVGITKKAVRLSLDILLNGGSGAGVIGAAIEQDLVISKK